MFSILLATHNGSRYIKSCINSILAQSLPNFEILIGVNGSTDHTLDILKEYNDSRIIIFNYDWAHKAKTLNELLKHAKYQWICIMDDDDTWEVNKLELQKNFINHNITDVVGTWCNYIDQNDNIFYQLNLAINHNDILYQSMNGNNSIVNTSAAVKRELLLTVNGWDENIIGIEDYDLWLKLLKMGKIFNNIPQHLVNHRVHSNSHFNTKSWDLVSLINKYK